MRRSFPTSRIVLYANPPVNETALRFTDDPDALVITHELTHIFHLDRSRGIWALGQHVFGRAPFLFPNAYSPSWLLEGLAVYYETRLTGTGRITGSDHQMLAHAAALEHHFPSIDEISLATVRFPYGLSTYVYGSLFMDYLSRTYGDTHMHDFVEAQSENLVYPLSLNHPASGEAFGISFSGAWNRWRDSLTAAAPDPTLPVPGWRFLTAGGGAANFARWVGDTAITYTGSTGREAYGAFSVSLEGQVDRLDRRNSDSPTLPLPNGDRVFSRLDYVDAYHVRSDLFLQHGGSTWRITAGARLSVPDLRADGRIVAVQTIPAGTRLVLIGSDGTGERTLTTGGPDEQWTEPRWSPDGHYVAAAHCRVRGGRIRDCSYRHQWCDRAAHLAGARHSGRPRLVGGWAANSLHLRSHRDYERLFCALRVVGERRSPADHQRRHGDLLSAAIARWALAGGECRARRWLSPGRRAGLAPHAAPPRSHSLRRRSPDESRSPGERGCPFDGVLALEHALAAILDARLRAIDSAGAHGWARATSGTDVVGRHSYDAQLFVPTDRTGVTGNADYAYAGLGMPVVLASGELDWNNEGAIFDDHRNRIGTLRERSLDGSLGLVFTRQRYRTFSSLSMCRRGWSATISPATPRVGWRASIRASCAHSIIQISSRVRCGVMYSIRPRASPPRTA